MALRIFICVMCVLGLYACTPLPKAYEGNLPFHATALLVAQDNPFKDDVSLAQVDDMVFRKHVSRVVVEEGRHRLLVEARALEVGDVRVERWWLKTSMRGGVKYHVHAKREDRHLTRRYRFWVEEADTGEVVSVEEEVSTEPRTRGNLRIDDAR